MHMRTTLNIDNGLIKKAAELTGVKEKTALVRLGLEALIASESAKRLAHLGGTEKDLQPIPRRRNPAKAQAVLIRSQNWILRSGSRPRARRSCSLK